MNIKVLPNSIYNEKLRQCLVVCVATVHYFILYIFELKRVGRLFRDTMVTEKRITAMRSQGEKMDSTLTILGLLKYGPTLHGKTQ